MSETVELQATDADIHKLYQAALSEGGKSIRKPWAAPPRTILDLIGDRARLLEAIKSRDAELARLRPLAEVGRVGAKWILTNKEFCGTQEIYHSAQTYHDLDDLLNGEIRNLPADIVAEIFQEGSGK